MAQPREHPCRAHPARNDDIPLFVDFHIGCNVFDAPKGADNGLEATMIACVHVERVIRCLSTADMDRVEPVRTEFHHLLHSICTLVGFTYNGHEGSIS